MARDLVREGRLSGERNPNIESLLSSMEADRNIADVDILVDIAHLVMLTNQKIIGIAHAKSLMKPLLTMYESGVPESAFDEVYEDIHAGVETELTRIAGTEAGGRLHIGRSRNDQVATCIRIKIRNVVLDQIEGLLSLREHLLTLAAQHVKTVMPGFTHLQHAQPTTLAHYFLSYEQAFARDQERLFDALKRVNQSPLGAAAFASTGYQIDRFMAAEFLGFDGLVLNTMDAVASRDCALEVLAADTILMTNISRICEELVIWSSSFVKFIDLNEIYCSTSSIMPQKKNPDVAEILRSRAGSLLGSLVSAVTIMKGLPMAYNRDMQDLNPHLWRGITLVRRDIDLLSGMINSATFDLARMEEEAGLGNSTATELADRLVRSYDIPFRTAHHIVGRAVKSGIITLATLDDAATEFLGRPLSALGVTDAWIKQALSIEASLEVRNHPGGPSAEAIKKALNERSRLLDKNQKEIELMRTDINNLINHLLEEARRILEL